MWHFMQFAEYGMLKTLLRASSRPLENEASQTKGRGKEPCQQYKTTKEGELFFFLNYNFLNMLDFNAEKVPDEETVF